MDNDIAEFSNFLITHKFSLELIGKFKIYQSILAEKNQKLNLVSKKSLEKVWISHFLDSILICDEFVFSDKSILDFGTGAGFPGMPLKLLFPKMNLFLLESKRKKTLFLRYLSEKLDLQKTKILNERIENLDDSFHNFFDFILVRAVKMKINYYEKCFQMLKKDGAMILYKGEEIKTELNKINRLAFFANVQNFQKKYSFFKIKNYILVRKNG
ncbi:MAG: 16S rRNA (guanine(527)-N(7))-methyltransferase RsmG [Candidatus Cloacimonetes bacterium]|nr:16S rRNA (guanine(527)-N(7))-methyltransferase RsmG [Candidatus Cloacimonadota bacterium]